MKALSTFLENADRIKSELEQRKNAEKKIVSYQSDKEDDREEEERKRREKENIRKEVEAAIRSKLGR